MTDARRRKPEDEHVCRRAATQAVGQGLREQIPLPQRGLGEDEIRRAYDMDDDDDRRPLRAASHVRKLINALSEADVAKLEKLLSLKPETVAWVDAKNDRELKSLDGAVDFINSSRTAAKVLMWVCGVAVTFVTGTVALAKSGYDLFALLRGGK
ncbi:hypothetical protein [Methylobacterium segetis]|uniref:hypothetical protein n=1 Tax=Methylobacterium segetis TaxID=2488750 RepID=UPI00104E42AF|nr:hypothetical protein [Methylobacterium segetis]